MTARKLDIRDLGAPVEGLRRQVVLGGVPEGAIANRIDPHGAVIAPAVGGIGLRARTGNDRKLRFQCAQRVSRGGRRPATAIEGYMVELDSL